MASQDYQQFIATFINTDMEAMQSGPDTEAIARLKGSERDQAEKLLLERVGVNDARPALGLGILRSKAASVPVRELMNEYVGTERELLASAFVPISLAVFLIDEDPRALTNVMNVLAVSPYGSIRVTAASALGETKSPQARDALLMAVENDKDASVRHNAAKALLRMHGLLSNPAESPRVTIDLMKNSPQVRAAALSDLRSMLAERPLKG
jgi:hypothetical protein